MCNKGGTMILEMQMFGKALSRLVTIIILRAAKKVRSAFGAVKEHALVLGLAYAAVGCSICLAGLFRPAPGVQATGLGLILFGLLIAGLKLTGKGE
jgi:hypothetical protein